MQIRNVKIDLCGARWTQNRMSASVGNVHHAGAGLRSGVRRL